jgi:hypothetical protein
MKRLPDHRSLLVAGALLCPALAAPAVAGAAADMALHREQWDFKVTLDGTPIGHHRFRLTPEDGEPDTWRLSSEADYDVRFLGIPVYRYRHQANELWRDGCLARLSADTDDDGERTAVQAQREGDALRIVVENGKSQRAELARGCVMTFAYWNPDLCRQTALLNPQTGRLDRVQIAPAGTEQLSDGGHEVNAHGWRILAPQGPVVVWFSAAGDWIGLDAVVSGKRKLSYRPQ